MLLLGAQQGFYAAAAGIIPVLFLVLMIGEGRVVRADDKSESEWRSTALIAIGVMAILVLGEMAALRSLALGHDSYALHGAVVSAVVYGFALVFAQAVKLILLDGGRKLSLGRIEALGRFYMGVVGIVLVLCYAILYPGFGLL
jgi:hypothetical protein